MASISLPPPSHTGFSQHFDICDQSMADSNRRLTMPAPMPNPPFVFPAHGVATSDSQLETSERRTPPPLPAFSFNPGSGQSSDLSVPPVPPVPSHYRPSGHRRRPSEFVGGEQLVTPEAVGTDDKQDDNSASTQSGLPPPGPGVGRSPGRRHHAHRRSAAVSGVDVNAIAKALGTNPGAGSAPCTPGDKPEFDGQDDISRPLSHSATSLDRPTPPVSPRIPPVPTAIHVEPAPDNDASDVGCVVPVISHESSASSITIKTPQPEVFPRKTFLADRERAKQDGKPKPRPKTADASLAAKFVLSNRSDAVPPIKRSKSSGHSRARKGMSTGLLDAARTSHEGDDTRSTDTSRASQSDGDGSDTSCDSNHDGNGYLSAKAAKSKKKQKRVRSWAGSILTRGIGKRHHEKTDAAEEGPTARPTPTPPVLSRTNSDVGSVNFDDDDIVILRTPTNPNAPSSEAEQVVEDQRVPTPTPTLETSWKPRSFYEQSAQEGILSSPVIDLDAALGPFNTPDMRPAQGVASNFSVATQRMYSGGRRGEFIGPEMRYHRRTESAPTLPPLDRSALGANRLGAAPAMENPDVFDEEEEDAFLAANSQSPKDNRPPAGGIATAPSEDDEMCVKSNDTAGTLLRPQANSDDSRQTGLGIKGDSPPEPTSHTEFAEPSPAAATDSVQNASNAFASQPRGTVEILKADECASRVPAPPSPEVSPRFVAVDTRPATSPVELVPSIPPFSLGGGVSPSDSSFPSPGGPRSITTSSTFDRSFASHSYHYLPSECPHVSTEDVPSLTSSASTTTNNINRFTAIFPRARMTGDRAASFSAAVHRRTSQANAAKRSSLVSLSKLVGGAHSERSKLSHEEKPPGDAPERAKKKGRRISRLMHFWKVKDKDKTPMGGPHDEPPS